MTPVTTTRLRETLVTRRRLLALPAAAMVGSLISCTPSLRGSSCAVVDMDRVAMTTNPTYAGVVTSTYGRMPTNSEQGIGERSLDARYFRIPIRWNGSRIVSSARGGNDSVIEDSLWTYYEWPQVRLMLGIGGRTDDWHGYEPGDTAAIVRRLQFLGLSDPSRLDFAGPNEPDRHGIDVGDVIARAVQISDELSSTGFPQRVWGPSWSHPSEDYLTFAAQLGPDRLAGVDWHSYPGGGAGGKRDIAAVLRDVAAHHDAVTTARAELARLDLPQKVNVDEINWTWDLSQRDLLFTAANTVMMALAYCTILTAGGRVMAYATQNGALSVLADS